jgi:hypothetical protein
VTPTPRQAKIIDWLRRLNGHAADMFVSALAIADNEAIPCRARMMAHAYREICIIIMNVYSANSRDVPKDQMQKFVNEFRKLSISFETPAAAPPTPDTATTPVPVSFLKAAEAAVRAHTTTQSARDRAQAVIEGIFGKRASQPDIRPMADRWFQMSSSFHKWAHNPTTPDAQILAGSFKEEVQYLEESLFAFAESAIANLDVLDDVLESANT